MNKINFLFFLILLFIGKNSFASLNNENYKKLSYSYNFLTININYDKKINEKIANKTLNLIKKATISQTLLNNIDNLQVIVNIFPASDKISFSNANQNQCKITLNYDTGLRGILLDKYENDLVFTYFHEISHCILGKKIFKNNLYWHKDLNLTTNEINNYNTKINKLTDENTTQLQCEGDCLSVKIFKKPPPLVVYHEIFADVMALFFYKEYDCKLFRDTLLNVENLRVKNYLEKKEANMHQSFRALHYIDTNNDNLCENSIDLQKIIFYTQKGFIDYLKDLDKIS